MRAKMSKIQERKTENRAGIKSGWPWYSAWESFTENLECFLMEIEIRVYELFYNWNNNR